MKTLMFKLYLVLGTIPVFLSVSGQKSIHYKSVATNLEEISHHINDTCSSTNKLVSDATAFELRTVAEMPAVGNQIQLKTVSGSFAETLQSCKPKPSSCNKPVKEELNNKGLSPKKRK